MQDLFDLNDPDIYAGFQDFLKIAYHNTENLQEAFEAAWPDNNKIIQRSLKSTSYNPQKNKELCDIISNRIYQLHSKVCAINASQPQDKNAMFQCALLSDMQKHLRAYPQSNRPAGI